MKSIHLFRVWLTMALYFFCSCNPEPTGQLQIVIQTYHASLGTGVSNIELSLKRRVLTDGILNGNYEFVDDALTDASGSATLNFQRVNALDYRLTATGPNWFSWEEEINPDIFIDVEVLSLSHEMMPSAIIDIHLFNANPFQPDDAIEFRTLNIPGAYPTCTNAWEVHTGMEVDFHRTCSIEADRYLPFIYRVFRNNEWTETIDSLYINQGENTPLNIAW